MKSSSKINLPPIPPSIFNKRIPSANNPNEALSENEKDKSKDKDKERPNKITSPIPETNTIPIPNINHLLRIFKKNYRMQYQKKRKLMLKL